jgi:hypothetical protein
VFGVLCIGAAIQAYVSYPETCGKSIEEIEELFRSGGPWAWQTKKGNSRLDAAVQAVIEKQAADGKTERKSEVEDKGVVG